MLAMSSTMIRTNLSIPEKLWNDVQQYAEEQGFSSKAEVVRVALKDYLYGEEDQAPEALLDEFEGLRVDLQTELGRAEEEIKGMRNSIADLDIDDRSFIQVVKRAREQILQVLQGGAVIEVQEPGMEWIHAGAVSYLLRNLDASETVEDDKVLLHAPGTDPGEVEERVPLNEVV